MAARYQNEDFWRRSMQEGDGTVKNSEGD